MTKKETLNPDRVIFQLSVEDIQAAAKERKGRKLKAEEVEAVERLVRNGWVIEWFTPFCIAVDTALEK